MYSDIAKKRPDYRQTVASRKRAENPSMSNDRGRRGALGHKTGSFLRFSIWVLIALTVVGVSYLLFTSLNNTSDFPEEVPSAEEVADGASVRRAKSSKLVMPNDGDEHGPRIKGIRLGMDYNSVKVVVEKLADKINEEDPKRPAAVKYAQENLIELQCYKEDGASFGFDDDKLVAFGFERGALKALFGLSPDKYTYGQFLQMLLDNYGIPNAKTRVYTNRRQSTLGAHLTIETRSHYDGSKTGGYEFKCREFNATGIPKSWSFSVSSYKGLNFDLPIEIDSSYVKNYEHGIGPVVKGFQLGMTRTEVIKTVKRMMPHLEYKESGDKLSYTCIGRIDSDELGLQFVFKDGKVCQFFICGRVLEFLFCVNPEYYIFKDFAQRAIDNYHIPGVKGNEQSSAEMVFTSYRHIGDGLEFIIGETRTWCGTRWEIGCRQLDSLKLD